MPISAAGTSSKGFTLLELVVVLVILASIMALVLPRLTAFQTEDVRTTARNCVTLLRYLDEQAVAGRNRYHLQINLNEQKITVFQVSAIGEERPPDDPFLQRNPLISGVRIVDLVTDRLGTVTTGTVTIPYGPGGLSEPLLLHLAGSHDQSFTVQALPVNASVRLAEGHLEMIR